MRFGACPHEKEIAALLERGHWPGASSPETIAHVAACNACRERILLTQAFGRERVAASASARLESPGVLWWRAQLRRRNAAIQRIGRPILGAQVFAVVVALISAAVFFASQARQSLGWFAWLAEAPRSLHLEALLPASWQNATGAAGLLAALLAALVLIGGAAIYASSDKP